MRPVYVCQLPEELQEEIREILTQLLLYQCGSEEEAEKCFGMSLADAVQNGMDFRIVDIDCAADPFKEGGCLGGKVPENIGKGVERLAEIIAQGKEMETDVPFLYCAREQAEENDQHELANVIWRQGVDDYGLWQMRIPLYLVRNILNSPESFVGNVDEIMEGVPLEPWPPGNKLHFLFPRDGRIVCCSMEMEEKFFAEYSTQGVSVRGSGAEIREELTILFHTEQTEGNEGAEC